MIVCADCVFAVIDCEDVFVGVRCDGVMRIPDPIDVRDPRLLGGCSSGVGGGAITCFVGHAPFDLFNLIETEDCRELEGPDNIFDVCVCDHSELGEVTVGISKGGVVELIACEVGAIGACGIVAAEGVCVVDVDDGVWEKSADLDGGVGTDEVAQNARWVAIPRESAESLASFAER